MPNAFRWNVARREQLGRLLTGEPLPYRPAVLEEVRRCAAHVLAMAGRSRLVFLGRSPENLYDYLSGALADTSVATRLALLNVSLTSESASWARMRPETKAALREQCVAVGLDPASLMKRARQVALVDVIYTGETFETLLDLLDRWAEDEGIDRRAMRRRLRIVGIVTRADLVRAFTRSDAEIEREIREDVFQRTMWIDGGRVEVSVKRGHAALTGILRTRSDVDLLVRLVGRVPGVVAIESTVTWDVDDTTRRGRRALEQAVT